MIYGTHNSQRAINPTSKCQDKNLDEQLADGVKLFNLPVVYVGGKMYGKTWLDKISLPKRHARLHNVEYKKNCKTEFLMLDFYGL